MEKWLKRLWLINGVTVLIASIVIIVNSVRYYLREYGDQVDYGPIVGEKLERAITDSLAIQEISLSLPRPIGMTEYHYVIVNVKDLARVTRVVKYADIGESVRMPYYRHSKNVLAGRGTVNLIFMKAGGLEPRLFLDGKALIETADIPVEGDSLQTCSIFRLVFQDANGDGRLTEDDPHELYVSDLNGLNLRKVTDGKLYVLDYVNAIRENKIYILAKVRPADPRIPESDWPDKVYAYDLRTNQLSSFFADEGLLGEVRKKLWSK